MQYDHMIVFESRKLNKLEHLKSTYDKEMMAIMHALAKWKQYLLGSKFMIPTDHNSLQNLLQPKTLSTEQHKWIEKNDAFDMEKVHKKGKDIVIENAISRKDEGMISYSVSIMILEWLDEI